MDQRLSFITLAVSDVARSREFFVDGLGWAESLFVPGEVLMIQVGPQIVLSLWDRSAFADEIGPVAESGGGFWPMTLAHNVASAAEVDEVIEEAVAAGATLRSAGVERDWGGYSGYFVDPEGFVWEVAFNPGPIGQSLVPPT